MRIAVIGIGALGSELCRLLAERGWTRVLLIDPDCLQLRNVSLSRFYSQVLAEHGEAALQQQKTELLLRLVRTAYSLEWTAQACEIADFGLAELSAYDILVSCTDSSLARVETALAARVLKRPMLDGGVMGEGHQAGRVSRFQIPRDAACYLCGIGEVRRAEILAYAASASLGCALSLETSSMTGTSDAVHRTAAEMLRHLDTFAKSFSPRPASDAERLFTADDGTWHREKHILQRSATCPLHDTDTEDWRTLEYDRPIVSSLPNAETRVQLLWPYCLEAACRNCGNVSAPLRRVARVRRVEMCIACGSTGCLEPTRTIESVGHDDPESELSPRQLCFPEQHLYQFRRRFSPATTRRTYG